MSMDERREFEPRTDEQQAVFPQEPPRGEETVTQRMEQYRLPPQYPPYYPAYRQEPPRSGRGMSQGAVIGLVITCCVTVLLTVLILVTGLVTKSILDLAAAERTAQPQKDQSGSGQNNGSAGNYFSSPYGGSNPFEGYFDDYFGGWHRQPEQGYGGNGKTGEEELPVLPGVHQEGSHDALQFLVSNMTYATGEEMDGVNNGKQYLILTLSATNLEEVTRSFTLSQFALVDSEGRQYRPVFPEYSYGSGLLPNSVTLQPEYMVEGSVIFEILPRMSFTLEIYESDGCVKLTIPLPNTAE